MQKKRKKKRKKKKDNGLVFKTQFSPLPCFFSFLLMLGLG